MTLTQEIAQAAQKVVVVTPEQARELPGFLGRLVPIALRHREYYACRVGGVRTLYLTPRSSR